MDREEAIKEAYGIPVTKKQHEALQILIPELAESEDEKIRKALIELVYSDVNDLIGGVEKRLCVSYIEKQKPLSTEETELNSISFLEQLGYTCVPPGAERKPRLEIYTRTKSKSFMESYMKGWNDAMEAIKREHKLAELSEGDEKVLDALIRRLEGEDIYVSPYLSVECLKSIRTQPKEEREPMEIKYGGKIYQVHGVRTIPGGITGYIIEDEPGHYDCIMNPEEVLGGGYGVKQNGSPYPTKEATFDYTHWGPSEEQITAVEAAYSVLNSHDLWGEDEHLPILRSLINDLKKLGTTE